MKKANEVIQREKHPMPTVDDLITHLNGSTVFSKLDLSNTYHQLKFGESSRYITTFTTHVGQFRYKRLVFGVNAASELFQKAIADLLRDIPGIKNISDNIIVHGCNQTSHDISLRATLERLQSAGAKLKKEKCLFSVRELTFFGHVFSERGTSPNLEKISTITKCKSPNNVSEVRSFLGMTQYVARFIPHHATITEPLRQLTKKGTEWRWSETEESALNKLKKILTGAKVMAYFDPNKDTNIMVDASPVRLCAVLTQDGKVLCYASRALTDVEQRYS